MPQGKPAGLHHKWPLLAEGQDPHALEARFAYHLHRLKISSSHLRAILGSRASITTSLTQARAGISLAFANQLAEQLGVEGDSLTRELTDSEAQAWAFYRMSARNPALVWKNARSRWEAAGLSQSDASRILGVRQSNLSMTLSGKRGDILDFQQAAKLLASVTSAETPGDLLVKD